LRRIGTWLIWWIGLMAFWVVLDDSVATDELLAGAGAAALGAFLAELVAHQTGTGFGVRAAWLRAAVRLPAEVARDTVIVFAVLARRLLLGTEPASGFRELRVDEELGGAHEALLIGARSLAPNTFVLGIEGGVMVVHQLVVGDR
jgi:multisubunit Na+/H+ antiporter MnhE subunit